MNSLSSKKVVLLIVEGENDKAVLEYAITKLFDKNKIQVSSVSYDVTSNTQTIKKNDDMCKEISKLMRLYRDKYRLKNSDFQEIIHLIDLDGAFISEENIVQVDNITGKLYQDNTIDCESKEKVIEMCERNKLKVGRVNWLLSKAKVAGIPYSLYFVSCNMDHVLDGNANISGTEKYILSEKWRKIFEDTPKKFIDVFTEANLILSEDYEKSWEIVKQETESLKRHSNINTLLKKYDVHSEEESIYKIN